MDLGYFSLFLLSFLAATIIPLASEAVLLAMLFAGYDPLWCLVMATGGNTLGAISTYYLGRMGSNLLGKKLAPEKYGKAKRWKNIMKKWGTYMGFFCWLPIIGDAIALALGIFRVNPFFAFFWIFIGKLARYVAIVYLAV